MEAAPAGMGLVLLGRKNSHFIAPAHEGLHWLQPWHHPLAALNHRKLQFLNWPGTGWSYCTFVKVETEGLFNSVAATCFGLKISEIHSCFGNKFVLSPDPPAGAMSCDSGPGGLRPAPLAAHGRFSLWLWMQSLGNCWVCMELVSRAVCWGEECRTRQGQSDLDLLFPKFRCPGILRGGGKAFKLWCPRALSSVVFWSLFIILVSSYHG